MTKLKAVKSNMKIEDKLTAAKLSSFNSAFRHILAAYSDCQDDLKAGYVRNLDFFLNEPLTAAELKAVIPLAIPDGYNGFDSTKSIEQLTETFSDQAQYFVAREGSVCIYVKPQGRGNVWLGDSRGSFKDIGADEKSFCSALGMFRFWWD